MEAIEDTLQMYIAHDSIMKSGLKGPSNNVADTASSYSSTSNTVHVLWQIYIICYIRHETLYEMCTVHMASVSLCILDQFGGKLSLWIILQVMFIVIGFELFFDLL